MIIFNNLWITMKKRKISTYQLREKTGIDSKTIRRLKANENIETKTLNKLCTALNCKLEDIAEYVQDYKFSTKLSGSVQRGTGPNTRWQKTADFPNPP